MADTLVDTAVEDCKERMARALEHTKSEFSSIRTGRAAPALVEKLKVEYYGADVPLQQLAGLHVPEARVLVITPYDKGSGDHKSDRKGGPVVRSGRHAEQRWFGYPLEFPDAHR